ncbi:MAG: prolipoprotein diacylglyceryl transferase [Clostridia bacterium]
MSPIVIWTDGQMNLYAHQALWLVGIGLCLWLGLYRSRKAGINAKACAVFAPLALFFGFFFAHLFYCLARFEYALYDLPAGSFFRFWEGPYMLYGAVSGCAIAAWLAAKLSKAPVLPFMDALSPAAALLIAISRIAEGLSGQGYGAYLEDGSAFAHFPFAVYDAYYEAWAWAVFVPAALVALCIFVVLLCVKRGKAGDKVLLLLGLYAAAQILLESLRRDDFLRWGFVRCSQVLSAVLLFFVLLCYFLRAKGRKPLKRALCFLGYAAMIALCLLLEFAVEQRISFLQFMEAGTCYAVMGCACMVLWACLLGMRSASLAECGEEAPFQADK